MKQALALLLDAYRELNARKLFWLTLGISGLVVVLFGSIAFTETGMSFFFGLWNVQSELNANSPFARPLYIGIFSYFIVNLWLSWAAAILALISTTSVFPDFLAGGAIDIVLSKPIGRLRLFLLKYLASLLFVILQIAVFCIGVFLCVGWRLDEWNFKIFLAVPLITVFFSYLFAVNVFVGVWTRSGLTALLLTVLFWFSLFGISTAENILRIVSVDQKMDVERADEAIATLQQELDAIAGASDSFAVARRERLQGQIDSRRAEQTTVRDAIAKIDAWHGPISGVIYVLPKTSETVGLVRRALDDPTGLNIFDVLEGDFENGNAGDRPRGRQNAERVVQEEVDSRSLWYVLGTSLIFELVVLSGAALIFCRRDF